MFVIKYRCCLNDNSGINKTFECKKGFAEFLKYLNDNKILYYKIISVENNIIPDEVKRIIELETNQSFFTKTLDK